MNKHTPGPWRLCAYGAGYGYRIYESNGAGPAIAEISDKRRDHHANARLIAAAPNLLAALQLTLRRRSARDPADTDYSRWHRKSAAQIGEILNDIRAAIAEATEEQS